MTALAELMTGVVETLDRARRRRQLSQEELGKRTGTNQATVSEMLRGRWKDIKLGTVVRMATALGLEVSVTVHPKSPITPLGTNTRLEASVSCFRCWCGFQCMGPTGEVEVGKLTADGRWTLWMGQGARWPFEVSDHVYRCPHAQDLYVVEIC
jgi:predicted XRE-type DNA-binding protein